MNKQTEALKMVIDYEIELPEHVIQACKEAIAQPAQEPVPLIRHENGNFSPAPSWQGLSDDEIVKRVFDNEDLLNRILYLHSVSKGLEQALKNKNYR